MNENEISESTPISESTSIREQFTTVTPISKFLAMVVFVTLPFVGFWLGTKQAHREIPNIACNESESIPNSKNEPEDSFQEQVTANPDQRGEGNFYQNTSFGFIFEYPAGWTVDTSDPTWPGPDGVILNDSSGNKIITISHSESLEKTSMAAPMDKRSTLKEALQYELSDIQEVSIGGGVAYEGTFTNDVIQFKQKQIWFEHQGHIYVIGLNAGYNPEVEKILSSFKWLE